MNTPALPPATPETQADYWQAVLQRDARYDDRLVYAVRTTGVYCRPSCSSRKPRPEHVLFFARPEQAEQAGFHACRRCQPDRPAQEAQAALIRQVCRYIEDHLDEPLTLERLGEQFALSPFHLQRSFKHAVGITPRQYAQARRLERVKAALGQGEAILPAVYAAGYGSSSRVYGGSASRLGMTPGAYRRGGAALVIRYALAPCALGHLLVAATSRGICAVRLGDDPQALEQSLRLEFPAAALAADDSQLGAWVDEILAYLDGARSPLDLPLDVQATAFQQRVWQALQAIPYGETRSYSQVAESLGHPGAARAVARACASNQAALVIPCHRVVRSDGSLGGYRWGLERKRRLLANEAQADPGD